MVGLSLNPKAVKDVGKISLITGIGQILFTTTIGFIISSILGFGIIPSMYIAIALAFSSTIIIMKILQDKNDTEALYGRIAIGFLIVQDIVAMVILMLVSSFAVANITSVSTFAFGVLVKITLLLGALYFTSHYILPRVMDYIAKQQEFLLLFSVGWCLFLSALFYKLGFSMEIGALLAGVSLAVSPYRYEISSKVKPLRDLFILLFFIFLGSQMVFTNIAQYILPSIIFSLFVLVGNPLIVIALMSRFGYTKKTSFLAGLTVAQISEFSLILVALGVSAGHLNPEILSMVTVVGLVTIGGSTYIMTHSDSVYPKIANLLSIFDKKGKKIDGMVNHDDHAHDVIVFGYDRIGYDLLETLKKIKKSFLVVDFNPQVVARLDGKGLPCRYGDASDCELLAELRLESAAMIVSTIPDFETNLLLVKKIREVNPKGIIIVVSHQVDQAIQLYEEGATYVLIPQFIGGHHTSTLIEEFSFDLNRFLREKAKHMKHLELRKNLGHDIESSKKGESLGVS
jgi:Kef-type K+ transport system membrane component KefB